MIVVSVSSNIICARQYNLNFWFFPFGMTFTYSFLFLPGQIISSASSNLSASLFETLPEFRSDRTENPPSMNYGLHRHKKLNELKNRPVSKNFFPHFLIYYYACPPLLLPDSFCKFYKLFPPM